MDGPRQRVDDGHQLEPRPAEWGCDVHQQWCAHLGHRLEHDVDRHARIHRRSASLSHSPSATPRPSRSPVPAPRTLPPSPRPSPSTQAQRWRWAMARPPRSARSRAGARSASDLTDPGRSSLIVGSTSTTFSGSFAGAGSLELDNGAALTLTGASNGGNIGTIGGRSHLVQLRYRRAHDQRRLAHRGRQWLRRCTGSGRYALGDQRRDAAGRDIGRRRPLSWSRATCSSPAPAPA